LTTSRIEAMKAAPEIVPGLLHYPLYPLYLDRAAQEALREAARAALFRVGGLTRGAPTRSFRHASGDAMTLGGSARLAYHGVDRIFAASSTLLAEGGRINLTPRRVTRA
jgi:hypothetical protein